MIDDAIFIWGIINYLSPLIFFILSRISLFKLKRKNLLNNYFSFFIVFECAWILLARLVFRDASKSPFDLNNILFLLSPLSVVILFVARKNFFVWFYVIFSAGTIIYCILNIFEPNMSLRLNMNVIVPNAIYLILFFVYLYKNFKEELCESLVFLKVRGIGVKNFPALMFYLLSLLVLTIIVLKFFAAS